MGFAFLGDILSRSGGIVKQISGLFKGRTAHMDHASAWPIAGDFAERLANSCIVKYGKAAVNSEIAIAYRANLMALMVNGQWWGTTQTNPYYMHLQSQLGEPGRENYFKDVAWMHAVWVLTSVPSDRLDEFQTYMQSQLLSNTLSPALTATGHNPAEITGNITNTKQPGTNAMNPITIILIVVGVIVLGIIVLRKK